MKGLTAALGMYDHGPQQAANDRLWHGIASILRARGIEGVPDRLNRTGTVEDVWHDPGLLFGQICGLPLVSDPTLALRVLALPVYDVPGCSAGSHCSFLVTRKDDATTVEAFRGRRAAINDAGSNTGMNLFRAVIASIADGRPFFDTVRETGSHRQSMIDIAGGQADIAAIDAVTYAAVLRANPELEGSLRILGESAHAPTPPFVTSRNASVKTVAALRIALRAVAIDPGLADARKTLFLSGIEPASTARYRPLLAHEPRAAAAGYPRLR